MAKWTVIPSDFSYLSGAIKVRVAFSNDQGASFEEWVPFSDLEVFKATLQAKIDNIEQTSTAAIQVKQLIGQPLDLTPVVVKGL